jgi:type II secretory pathway component GspD/PulD (secretin)
VRRLPGIGRAVLAGAVMFALLVATADAADYVVIKVMHRPADELVEAIKAILSPNGVVTSDERNNTLIVVDEPSVLKKAEELVAALDVRARQVRLSVTFFEAEDRHTVDLSIRWRYNDGGFRIGNFGAGRGAEGLTVGGLPGATGTSTTSVTTQELLVISGETGRFVTGTDVPVTDEILTRLGRGGIIRERVAFREVSSGFVFTPTILDTEVHLDITPFLSYFIDEEEGSLIFCDAKTTVSIPDGRTVVIAGNETDKGKLIGDIFAGFSKSGETGSFYIAVTPRIEE